MYTIYCNYTSGDQLLYNDITPELEICKLIDPSLSLSDNSAGSFKARVPKGNQCYSLLNLKNNSQFVRVDVKRDNVWVWSGRVLTSEMDFWLQREITCEGALAWLNDAVCPLAKYTNKTIDVYVQTLLDIYNNSKGGTSSKWAILRGAISTSSSSGSPIPLKTYIVDGDNVLSYLTKIAEDWGLHMRIRENAGKLYLDMLTDTQLPMSSQTIDFGENLLDYADNYDISDLVTQILPYGAELETTNTTGDEEFPDKLTISGKTASKSTMQVVGTKLRMKSTYNTFGCIEQTVTWSDIDNANTLLSLAELYLSDFQFNAMRLTVKTLDLHYLTSSKAAFTFLSQVNCVSRPHGLNSTFIISEMTIPFDHPENTTFTFSRSTMGLYGSDRSSSLKGGKISGMKYDEKIFSREGVLMSARRNATEMIEMATNGYVTMVPSQDGSHTQSLVISNTQDYTKATQKWTWGLGGLMFQDRATSSSAWNSAKLALTMDGQIVANRITTGQLIVDDGQGGILLSADMSNSTVTIASFTVKGTKLYSSKSTLSSNTSGVYIGTDGFSTGSGYNFIAMSYGQIYGGSNGNNGYIIFTSYSTTSGIDGIRVAGRGFVSIITADWFGISDRWYSKDSDATVYSGATGTILVPYNFQLHSDGGSISLTNDWHSYYFYKGILNTVP